MKKTLYFVLLLALGWVLLSACGEASKASEPLTKSSDSLSSLITSIDSDAEDVGIEQVDNKVNVYYTDGGQSWDESSFVRKHLSNYINYCLQAYGLEGVDNVVFYVKTKMTDEKGNESTPIVIGVGMNKTAFSSYNWENMKYKSGLIETIKPDCDILQIHQGILKACKSEDIFYS